MPITVFHGEGDELISEEEMRSWCAITSGPFTCHLLPGGHLFVLEDHSLKPVLYYIEQSLSGLWEQ
jgi:surfactin synthase thioesterase subunit